MPQNAAKPADSEVNLVRRVHELAHNIWWTWNPRAQELFRQFAPRTWVQSGHNAVAVVNSLSEAELSATLHGPQIEPFATRVLDEFRAYMDDRHTWADFHVPQLHENPVAYFSAEFGLHESLPIYSGGLGILSGDHIKSASDLGLPFVGIGLFYRQGYFSQRIDNSGWQKEVYPVVEPDNLPISRVLGADGEPLTCQVPIADSMVRVGAWRVNVGRVPLYLLDTNFPQNDENWRNITANVYGGDKMTRICQELVLGVGGIRFMDLLGIRPSVYHMNEGHSCFLILELLCQRIEGGMGIEEARAEIRRKTIFTTHTPVPAGHDRFTTELLTRMMPSWPGELGLTMEEFMDLGRVRKGDATEEFCMTVLGLRNCRNANAVSELNGDLCRQMWFELTSQPDSNVPFIGHVTNGIHLMGWMNGITYNFWEKTLGEDWMSHLKQPDFWQKVVHDRYLTDHMIWGLRYRLKRQMIEYIRDRFTSREHGRRHDEPLIHEPQLNPDALTIGFARRFATYKRANLIFHDMDRIERILNDPERPVQIIFAGKAHPRDDAAKAIIQQIFRLTIDPRFAGKVFLVEDYDIALARLLGSGIDVLLNNPQRPLEACGTSGQKIAMHGGLNLSIMDGWWREGYQGNNGFQIGRDMNAPDPTDTYEHDATALYDVLENQVIPEFYDRDGDGLPRKWIQRVRRAMATLIPKYTTDRMVAEYTEKHYLPRD